MTVISALHNFRYSIFTSSCQELHVAPPLLDGIKNCLCAIFAMEFAEDVADMVFHGVNAEAQCPSNITVGSACHQQTEHLHFAPGQLLTRA